MHTYVVEDCIIVDAAEFRGGLRRVNRWRSMIVVGGASAEFPHQSADAVGGDVGAFLAAGYRFGKIRPGVMLGDGDVVVLGGGQLLAVGWTVYLQLAVGCLEIVVVKGAGVLLQLQSVFRTLISGARPKKTSSTDGGSQSASRHARPLG